MQDTGYYFGKKITKNKFIFDNYIPKIITKYTFYFSKITSDNGI